MGLTASQAQLIFDKNLLNLAKKVNDGKPLTSAELALLRAAQEGAATVDPPFVRSIVELATVLKVSRKTVDRWLKKKDHPPTASDGRYNVVAWKEYKRQLGTVEEDPDQEIDANRERARNVLLQNERLEFQINVLRKNYVPFETVEDWGAQLGGAVRTEIVRWHAIAPTLAGLSIPEIEARLVEQETELLQKLHLLDGAMRAWRDERDNALMEEGKPVESAAERV